MRHFLYWLILIFLSFILQGRLSVIGVPLDLTTLLVYYAGTRYGQTKSLLLGGAIGALEDILSSTILGPNMLAKGIIGFSVPFFTSGGFFRWTPLLGIIAVSFFTLIDNTIVFLARSLFDTMPTAISNALFIAVMQSLLNAPAGIFIRPKHAD